MINDIFIKISSVTDETISLISLIRNEFKNLNKTDKITIKDKLEYIKDEIDYLLDCDIYNDLNK